MLLKFLYVDMGVENMQKHRWTAEDNRKIKAFYKEGRIGLCMSWRRR